MLVINTTTSVITFLMVFLIQSSQVRDSKSLHLKIDELLRAVTTARTRMVDLEDLSESELEKVKREFEKLGSKSGARGGRNDDAP